MSKCSLLRVLCCCAKRKVSYCRRLIVSMTLVSAVLFITGYKGDGRLERTVDSHFHTPIQNRTTTTTAVAMTTPKMTFRRHGYDLAQYTKTLCGNVSNVSATITVRWSREGHVMDCPTYKIASTFWKRVFMIQKESGYKHLSDPFKIPYDRGYPGEKYTVGSRDISKTLKVMFTRDPFRRIYSAYVDKMMASNPYFWKQIGLPIVQMVRSKPRYKILQCGHDITFSEFVKYIILTMTSGKGVDDHFKEITSNCRPCEIGYDFIGKMENFGSDSLEIIRRLSLSKTESLLRENGSHLAAMDAIADTVSQPFVFRKKYIRCISFQDALHRAWRKLRLRGLIGNQTLTLNNKKELSLGEFTKLAKESYLHSEKAEREEFKKEAYKEMWRTVPIGDLHKLQKLYDRDFRLFDYDESPKEIFEGRT